MPKGARDTLLPDWAGDPIPGPFPAPDLGRYVDTLHRTMAAFVAFDPTEVHRMDEATAAAWLWRIRWSITGGERTCPWCLGRILYQTARGHRCRACRRDFTDLSLTVLHAHKLSARKYALFLHLLCVRPPELSLRGITIATGIGYKSALALTARIAAADLGSEPFALGIFIGTLLVRSGEVENDWIGRRCRELLLAAGPTGMTTTQILRALQDRGWLIGR